MRDVFHIFPDITADSVSATETPASASDFGLSDRNTPKFNSKHKSGVVSKEAYMVFELATAVIAVSNPFTLIIQESTDDSTYTTRAQLPTITPTTTSVAIGTRWILPLPTSHARYIRPAVITGATWGATRTFKCWIEMGRYEDGRLV